MRRFLPLLALLPFASPSAAQVIEAPAGIGWRSIATNDDRERLRDWREAWVEALTQIRAGSNAGEIAREGALFEPDIALPNALPPVGDYDCRTIKLGSPDPAGLDYVAYPAFRCRLHMRGGRLHFTKLTGSQRPVGIIFPDNSRRMIFLGTLMLGDERLALRYGRDRERNLIGIVERVGDGRWRIAFPRPHFESLLDITELVPRD